MEVFMKGLGNEKVYKVYKKGAKSRIKQSFNRIVMPPILDKLNVGLASPKLRAMSTLPNLESQNNPTLQKNRTSDAPDENTAYQQVMNTERSAADTDRGSDHLANRSEAGDDVR
jgi:hypothetical protein